MKLIKSTAIIGTLTLMSRVLGLVRDTLTAGYLGAGPVNDALVTAYKIPNTFRRIFAEGAFNAAFVPLYARRIEEEGERPADAFASEAFAALLVLVSAIVIVFEMTMPWTLNLFGAGLSREGVAGADFPMNLSSYDLAVIGAQITMPYLLLISLTSMFSGILNTRHRFAAAAFTPVLLNLVLIGIFILMGRAGWDKATLALYLAAGMTVSGVFQLSLVVWACAKAGVKIKLQRPRLTPGVRRLFVLGVPGMFAAGITHINIMVSHNISTLQEGAPSWLNYADRLYQLPLGMIGIAMGVALLPTLSRRLRGGDEQGAKTSLNRALEIAAFLTMPAAIALAVMPEFLVAGLFQRGAFNAHDSAQTGLALRMFAFGLPAFVLIKVLTPAFFARENTKTPMVFAAISAVINLSLGVLLFWKFGFWGLAFATSVAGWVNVVFLTRTLLKSGQFSPDKRLLLRLPRITIAALIMGVLVWYLSQKFMPMLSGGLLRNYSLLALVSGAGLVFYALCALVLRAYGPSDIRYAIGKS
ncbi:MAG TPA: murein biosynthesis integral membrane protein MurJ [Hellea balneolensis]|uniref:Probable lipid II flippase MurJ n=1 Tax=Hellea balneolensis TaxID=287478 RepID=A0A7C5QVW8_9PROT|nr:murein biosynthesis integral membrane protein MurJ [Hellea balneolensis]